MLSSDTRYRPSPEVVDTTLPNGEVVLLQLATRSYYTLNQTGSQIWQLLARQLSIDEICGALGEKYDVTPDEARASVSELLSRLAEAQLAQPASPAGPAAPSSAEA